MRILGIDPGLGRLGWAVIAHERSRDNWIASGCMTTRRGDALSHRLLSLSQQLSRVLSNYHPQRAAVEKLFFAANAKTAMMVGEARGVILLAIAQARVPLSEITPNEVKLAITGTGSADKRQVAKMVPLLLHDLPRGKRMDDEMDALAIAIAAARKG